MTHPIISSHESGNQLSFKRLRCTVLLPPYANTSLVLATPHDSQTVHQIQQLVSDRCNARLLHPSQPYSHVEHAIIIRSSLVPTLSTRLFSLASSNFSAVHARRSSVIQSPKPALSLSAASWTSANVKPSIDDNFARFQTHDRSAISSDLNGVQTPFYLRYQNISECIRKWRSFTRMPGANVRLNRIGKSLEGRPLFLLRVGSTSATNPRRLFLNSLQHAREWVTLPVVTYIMERLALAIANDEQPISTFLSAVEVLAVPLVNPDGYVHSYETDREYRKNRRRGTCVDPVLDGVDLNRNWDIDFNGTSSGMGDPCSDQYAGSAPFSEPETRALRDLILRTDGIIAHLDIHSFAQVVLGAWSYTEEPAPRSDESFRVGSRLALDISSRYGKRYRYGVSSVFLYPASGVMSDWAFSQGIMSFTVEVRPDSSKVIGVTGFELAESEIIECCREVYAGIPNLLTYVNDTSVAYTSAWDPQASRNPKQDEPSFSSSSAKRGFHATRAMIIAVVAAAFVVIVIIIIISLIIGRFRRRGQRATAANDGIPGMGKRHYTENIS